jgi:Protein of unknown function (DUF2628)
MAIYTVHLPPEATTRESVAEKAVFVKEGFSIPGFVFTGLWLLMQRLWLHAIAYLLLFGLAVAAFRWLGLPPVAFGGVTALLALLIGLEGHEWIRARYARKGWTHVGTVSGPTLDECERRFFQDWLAAQPAPPQRPLPTGETAGAQPARVLGLFPEARGRA